MGVVQILDTTSTLPPLSHRFPSTVYCDTVGVGGCIKRCFSSSDKALGKAPEDSSSSQSVASERAKIKFCWTLRCLVDCTALGSYKCKSTARKSCRLILDIMARYEM